MSIYKGIDHPLHLCLEAYGLSELSIQGPSKDIKS